MSSKQAELIYNCLKEIFPHNIILREHYINFKGIRLFFDFYIKDLRVLIEVQGRQHTHYVEHFHGDREGFLKQKMRDNLKIQLVEEQGTHTLVRFNYDEKITKDLIRDKICNGLEGCFYE